MPIETINYRWVFALITALISTLPPAHANNRSCSYGSRAVCVEFGDKVCDSTAKCVDQDATCVDAYACNYEGVICKSSYDDLGVDFDELVGKYKELSSDFDNMKAECSTIATECQKIEGQRTDLIKLLRSVAQCINTADSLAQAQTCVK